MAEIKNFPQGLTFATDAECLEHLFNLYEQMIEEEKARGTLFEVESRTAKKAKRGNHE